MFNSLSDKLGKTFDKLKGRGVLKESDIDSALREVRMALLEADVALSVVRSFIESVKKKALGENVLRSVTPGQQVVKIVHDELVNVLGGSEVSELKVSNPASVVLMLGLQGAGKTTSSAKLAVWFKKQKKKVLLASLDIYRPAAMQQLKVLGEQIEVDVLPIIFGQKPVEIAERAKSEARKNGYDILILDTAGRLHIDEELMDEVALVSKAVNPAETLLVADAMMGQDAANVAKEFNEKVGVSGIILTRMDGDSRGGAALSMRHISGSPIRFLGIGEKTDALQAFTAERLAGRILNMGDIVSLVEKASEVMDAEESERLTKRMFSGQFNLDDMLQQIRQMRKMGDIGGLMSLIPGVGKMKKALAQANVDDNMIAHQEAILLSMTKKERAEPRLLNASRKKRIASGSGTTVQEINKLLKQYQQTSSMMKKMGKKGMGGMMKALMGGDMPDMAGGSPQGGMPDLSKLQLPPNLGKGGNFPGGGGLPGLGGSNNPLGPGGGFPFGKKK